MYAHECMHKCAQSPGDNFTWIIIAGNWHICPNLLKSFHTTFPVEPFTHFLKTYLYMLMVLCALKKKGGGDRTEYGRGQGVRCMLCLVSLAPVLVSFHGNSLV